MPLALKANGAHRYSDREKKLFGLLPQNGTSIDTDQLLKQFFNGSGPINARISLVGSLRGLADKVERNKEPFQIKKSERRGPHPMSFWIEKRPGR